MAVTTTNAVIKNANLSTWSPTTLFAAGEQGAWYDPSNLNTMYQDSAGTTPVTAVEQPVGAILDSRDISYAVNFNSAAGEYLTLPANTINFMHQGATDWTWECWFYTGSTTEICLLSTGASTSNIGILIELNNTTTRDIAVAIFKGTSGTAAYNFITNTNVWSLNTWTHIAITYTQLTNTYKIYKDGISQTLTTSGAGTYSSSNASFVPAIGRYQFSSPGAYFNGVISNMRAVNNSILYTSNFTPPTSRLTPVTGTVFLTCGTTWISNPTITTNGPSTTKNNPFTTGTGNHAYQNVASSSRPVLSARYNLFEKSEQFDNAYWDKYQCSVTANATTAPDGTTTADKYIDTAVNDGHALYRASSPAPALGSYTFSIYVKDPGEGRYLATRSYYANGSTDTWLYCTYNLSNQTVNVQQKTSLFTNISTSVTSVGNDWYKCSVSWTFSSSGWTVTNVIGFQLTNTPTPTLSSTGGFSYLGNGSGIFIWGASLTVANDGVAIPYQRVNTSTDYDSNPNLFPYYLKFDGTDDSLATSSIDFTGGDSMSVSAGVRKLSDAALGVVAELSSTIASNNGTFLLSAPNSAAANYNYSSKGTAQSNNTITTYTSPISNVLVCNSVISTDTNNIYVNNGSATASATDQGSGNYGNYAMYLGRRGGASSPFNGRLFNLIVRAGSLSTTQAAQIATYLNGKDKIF